MPPTVDHNEFFREVTLRLCSNPELAEALHACVEYIGRHMPADAISLGGFEEDFESYRVLAVATPEGGFPLDVLVPMPPDVRAARNKYKTERERGQFPTVMIVKDSSKEPMSNAIDQFFGEESGSVLIMPLAIAGAMPGTLALAADDADRYTAADAELFALLKEPFHVALTNALRLRRIRELYARLEDDNRFFRDQLRNARGAEIIGADFGLQKVMQLVRRVAAIDSSVLITGETGTGKEVIANEIHLLSERNEAPFITVNCGAIPDSLIDSELFGHEKGAFTGALSRKRGRFERANGGTIFLDEIGELPMGAQVRLLRVLQERTIERVGGSDEIDVDIRVIAATHRDLPAMVAEGSFREDLYYRLKVIPIEIPSLRDRVNDIPALVQYALQKKAKELKIGDPPPLAPGAMDRLMAYSWPGNVRELENVVERELITCLDSALTFSTLDPVGIDPAGCTDEISTVVFGNTDPVSDGITSPDPSTASLLIDDVMADHIRRVLDLAGGQIEGAGGAAELLGINPATLRNRMRKLGVAFGRARP